MQFIYPPKDRTLKKKPSRACYLEALWVVIVGPALLIAACLFLAVGCKSAHAQEAEWVEPALLVGAVLAVQKSGVLEGKCIDDPCNTVGHMAIGAGISYYVGKKYGWQVGLAAAVAAGIGKELLDKNFDVKDAAATAVGGAIVSYTWEF